MSQKTARLLLWVVTGEGNFGQQSRPCVVTYSVNPIGSHFLYNIESVTDAWLPKAYSVASVISLNGNLDPLIVAADETQCEFARKELGFDPKKVKPSKPKTKPIPFPEHPTLPLP